MRNRIQNAFAALAEKGATALITYVTAGDPDMQTTEQIIRAKVEGGADIIELGIPFSDPLADGPVIQAAALRSLEAGTTPEKVFSLVKKIRNDKDFPGGADIPIVFLVYYNTILGYGPQQFIKDCAGLVDGLVVPDLPLEEAEELLAFMDPKSTTLIPMVAPTSRDRIASILKAYPKEGFVYCVTSLGVTGMDSNFYSDVKGYLQEVKKHSKIPICAGFGVKDSQDFADFSEVADGVIVGSAIVDKLHKEGFSREGLSAFVSSFRKGK